jgi:hypothetical protein
VTTLHRPLVAVTAILGLAAGGLAAGGLAAGGLAAGGLAAGGLAAGCSWMSMGPVPDPSVADRSVECKTSRSAPAADVFGAAFFGAPGAALVIAGAAGAAGPGCNDNDWCIVDGRTLGYLMIGAGVIGLGVATAYGLSARHGLRHAARCEELRGPTLDLLPTPSRLPKEPPAVCCAP